MALLETNCPTLKLLARGKVRDIYELENNLLLLVATDRISAFDVQLGNGIPGRGKVLTQLSAFWFEHLQDLAPSHVVATDINDFPAETHPYRAQLEGRSLVVQRLEMLPFEAIVRGYIAGSAWKEYSLSQSICGMPQPAGLVECARLSAPIFTPSTKAADGGHDENVHPDTLTTTVGKDLARGVAELAVALYSRAAALAADRGMLIADTKFEFGLDAAGVLTLGDEALTPDSSRFWLQESYKPGVPQGGLDKQFIRDYLESSGMCGVAGAVLPREIVNGALARYIDVFQRLTGRPPAL